MLRQGIFFIHALYALNHFFGIDGVIYTTPIADYLSVIISYIVCIYYMKKMNHHK